ncbi:methyltransferase domain-containing protein [Mucilaginibacter myungsuensis]|uniref:methyltransferase domain-containing protein n=1 Tax=Mucilaginibacter myungsuensis TaxID=649104 RepID=UPI00338E0855
MPADTKFEIATAFEVFEHLPDPIAGIKEMLAYSDNLLFTTELQPEKLDDVNDRWYFIPETGQHLSLFNEPSLKYLADKLGYNFYTDGKSLHLFTKQKFSKNPVKSDKDPFLIRKAKKLVRKTEQKLYGKREGLLERDWKYIKGKLSK